MIGDLLASTDSKRYKIYAKFLYYVLRVEMPRRQIVLSINTTESEVIQHLREYRFGKNLEKLHCIYCGSKKVIKYGWRGPARRYKCKDCGKTFTDTTNTTFENNKIKPSTWLLIAYLHLKLGLTTNTIARELRMPYKTVWGAIKKIQKAAKFFQRHAKA